MIVLDSPSPVTPQRRDRLWTAYRPVTRVPLVCCVPVRDSECFHNRPPSAHCEELHLVPNLDRADAAKAACPQWKTCDVGLHGPLAAIRKAYAPVRGRTTLQVFSVRYDYDLVPPPAHPSRIDCEVTAPVALAQLLGMALDHWAEVDVTARRFCTTTANLHSPPAPPRPAPER